MAEVIRMPRMSDTMEEGVIAAWQKKVGDEVKSGDVLAEVETDKATMELESYEDGTLLYIGVEEKQTVPVDGVIAIIGKKDENIDDILAEIKKEGASSSKKSVSEESVSDVKKNEVKDTDISGINASVIKMPRMSDTMTEGTITRWYKKIGDKVKLGDILAEVETDKANMELESYEDGFLLYIGVKDGEVVRVDEVIAVIGEKGADYQKLLEVEKTKAQTGEETVTKESPVEVPGSAQELKEEKPEKNITVEKKAESGTTDGRIKASPLAKKLARELGYDLSRIQGSGDHGRIIRRDIESYQPQPEPAAAESEDSKIPLYPVAGEEHFEEVAISQMRKTIARRLAESKFTAPHFYLTMEINMDRAIQARKSINEHSPLKISFNDMIIKAVAAALRKHPKVNASWLGDKIRYNQHIHIGVAVAVDEGLLVPVIRFADSKTLSHIAVEVKELSEKARNKQLQPADWEGNTFTVSNLGMFGIEEFTAIINPPDACILAIGGIKETAIVKDGQLIPGNVMKVTMSCDHRVVDGATGATFLQTFKNLLEDPVRILI